MDKLRLMEEVSNKVGMPIYEVEVILNAAADVMRSEITNNGSVSVDDLGRFGSFAYPKITIHEGEFVFAEAVNTTR